MSDSSVHEVSGQFDDLSIDNDEASELLSNLRTAIRVDARQSMFAVGGAYSVGEKSVIIRWDSSSAKATNTRQCKLTIRDIDQLSAFVLAEGDRTA